MVGRPLKFKTPEELQLKINEYFKNCKENNTPLTVEMLAWSLGMSRQALLDYEAKDEFLDTIKSAKEFVLATKVENLNREKTNTAGIIFDLCNNGGYSNKHNDSEKSTTIIINDKSKEISNVKE